MTTTLDPRWLLLKVSKPDAKPAPGRIRGTATIRVAFDLKVGEPYTAKVAAAVPWQRIAALALSKLNTASQEATVREALDPTNTADIDEVAGRAAAIVAELLDSTERTCEGKITGTTSIVSAEIETA